MRGCAIAKLVNDPGQVSVRPAFTIEGKDFEDREAVDHHLEVRALIYERVRRHIKCAGNVTVCVWQALRVNEQRDAVNWGRGSSPVHVTKGPCCYRSCLTISP